MSLKQGHNILLTTFVVALFGIAVIFLATPHGAGLSPDSLGYFRSAREILEHGVFAKLSTHWPPGYPFLLSAFSAIHGDIFLAARTIGIIAFGINLFLFGQLMQRVGWESPLQYFLILILICDPAFLWVHLMAWSEPAFLVFLQLGLLALLRHDDSRQLKHVAMAGLAFGAAVMVRYAGVAFIAAISAIFLTRLAMQGDKTNRSSHLKTLLCFSTTAILPLLLWIATKGNSSPDENLREFTFHAIERQKWMEGLSSIGNWFGGIWSGVAIMIVATTLLLSRAGQLSRNARFLLLSTGVLMASYAAFITISLMFVDAYIPLDNRILIPLKLLVYVIIFLSIQTLPGKWRIGILIAFTLLALLLNYPSARMEMKQSSLQGIGFANTQLSKMPILHVIRTNDLNIDATNAPELTFLFLNQETALLPRTFNPTTKIANPDLERKMQSLKKPGKTVVLFSSMQWREYLYTPTELYKQGFTKILYQGPDGVILQYKQQQEISE